MSQKGIPQARGIPLAVGRPGEVVLGYLDGRRFVEVGAVSSTAEHPWQSSVAGCGPGLVAVVPVGDDQAAVVRWDGRSLVSAPPAPGGPCGVGRFALLSDGSVVLFGPAGAGRGQPSPVYRWVGDSAAWVPVPVPPAVDVTCATLDGDGRVLLGGLYHGRSEAGDDDGESVVVDTSSGAVLRCFRWRSRQRLADRLRLTFWPMTVGRNVERLVASGTRWLAWAACGDWDVDIAVFLLDCDKQWCAPVYRYGDDVLGGCWVGDQPMVLTQRGLLRFDEAARSWRFDGDAWSRLHASVGMTGDQLREDIRAYGCHQLAGHELRVLLVDAVAPGRSWLVRSGDGGVTFDGVPLELPENAHPVALGCG